MASKKNSNTVTEKAKKFYEKRISSEYDPHPYYDLIQLYFERTPKSLASHHIDSFNQFIDVIIGQILTTSKTLIHSEDTEYGTIDHRLVFSDVKIAPPTYNNGHTLLYPDEAELSKHAYSGNCTCTVEQVIEDINVSTGEVKVTVVDRQENVSIGKIPIMVHSKYCNLTLNPISVGPRKSMNQGGYFVVRGGCRIVMMYDTEPKSKPLVLSKKKGEKSYLYTLIRSHAPGVFYGTPRYLNIKYTFEGEIVTSLPVLKNISVFMLLRALGISKDSEIIDLICKPTEKDIYNHLVRTMHLSRNSSGSGMDVHEARVALTGMMNTNVTYTSLDDNVREQQRYDYLMNKLSRDLLPHINDSKSSRDKNLYQKGCYIGGVMVRGLIIGYLTNSARGDLSGCDDRDSLMNKRYMATGIILADVFEIAFKSLIRSCQKAAEQKRQADGTIPSVISSIKPSIIESSLRKRFINGIFSDKDTKEVSQILDKSNNANTLSYTRRVLSLISPEIAAKVTAVRFLHPTQRGVLCPVETPSGITVGLTKGLAMCCQISVSLHEYVEDIMEIIEPMMVHITKCDRKLFHYHTKVIVDGDWVGMTEDPIKMYQTLREMRFQQKIHSHIGLSFDYDKLEFHVRTHPGRAVHVYLTVFNNKITFQPEQLKGIKTWQEYMKKYPRAIEFIDKEEEKFIRVAEMPYDVENAALMMNRPPITDKERILEINNTNRYDDNVFASYTHCEIHPVLLYGSIACCFLIPNCNQGPRNIFASAQSRNVHAANCMLRNAYLLHHSMKAISYSAMAKIVNADKLPYTEMCLVAIMSYGGYNIEDSISINGSATYHGFLNTTVNKEVVHEIQRNRTSSQDQVMQKPDPSQVSGMRDGDYSKLNDKGFVPVGTRVKKGTVLMGVLNHSSTNNSYRAKPFEDASIVNKDPKEGIVTDVFIGGNAEGGTIIRMNIASHIVPNVGDKISSQHGQKGTIGSTHCRMDMPFTECGLTPDLLVNPNALPKRMTWGQLIEGTMNEVYVTKGCYGDATAFSNMDECFAEAILSGMKATSVRKYVMYDGYTGIKMKEPIHMGMVTYQVLKQLSIDKETGRGISGPNQQKYHQPSSGKKNSGGLKFGEMEKDGVQGHGMAAFFFERSVTSSDVYLAHICDICGGFCGKNIVTNYYYCQTCKNNTRITPVKTTYTFKLLVHNLYGMGINTKLLHANSVNVASYSAK